MTGDFRKSTDDLITDAVVMLKGKLPEGCSGVSEYGCLIAKLEVKGEYEEFKLLESDCSIDSFGNLLAYDILDGGDKYLGDWYCICSPSEFLERAGELNLGDC